LCERRARAPRRRARARAMARGRRDRLARADERMARVRPHLDGSARRLCEAHRGRVPRTARRPARARRGHPGSRQLRDAVERRRLALRARAGNPEQPARVRACGRRERRRGDRAAGGRAEPGPASYGWGGTEPTLTDANVIAGRINPGYFLGGDIELDVDRAREALRPLAMELDVSVEDAALGVIRIANANMIHLLKLVSVRRGRDPRDFAIVAFGGGGSMHATALAR